MFSKNQLVALKEVELFKREQMIREKEDHILGEKELTNLAHELGEREFKLIVREKDLDAKIAAIKAEADSAIKIVKAETEVAIKVGVASETKVLQEAILHSKDKEIETLTTLLKETIHSLQVTINEVKGVK